MILAVVALQKLMRRMNAAILSHVGGSGGCLCAEKKALPVWQVPLDCVVAEWVIQAVLGEMAISTVDLAKGRVIFSWN